MPRLLFGACAAAALSSGPTATSGSVQLPAPRSALREQRIRTVGARLAPAGVPAEQQLARGKLGEARTVVHPARRGGQLGARGGAAIPVGGDGGAGRQQRRGGQRGHGDTARWPPLAAIPPSFRSTTITGSHATPCPHPIRADEAHVEQTNGQVEKLERALEPIPLS